jgi:hypothetical protein
MEAPMNRYYARLQDPDTVYELAHDLFLAGSITCFLYALHRIARGLTLTARVKALDEFEDAYEPDVFVHRKVDHFDHRKVDHPKLL